MRTHVWIVRYRNSGDPKLYWTREEVLADPDVQDDLRCAEGELEIGMYDDHMYVDDGFDARLVELPDGDGGDE